VFTHDNRLTAAVKALSLPATILEVTRQPRSDVAVRKCLDASKQALDDAGAVDADQNVPEAVAARVIPTLCRTAVESAHPDMRGLSGRNLRYMATLASGGPMELGNAALPNCPGARGNLARQLPGNQDTSAFYAKRAAKEGWTRPVLRAMIATRLHERTQPALTTFDQSVPDDDQEAVPAITINMATDALSVTPRAVGQNLDRLVAVGILREIPGSGRPAACSCPGCA
jgi:hypothetical protein